MRRAWVIGLAVIAALAAAAPPATLAAAESRYQTLPTEAIAAITSDLDGDGAREVVLLVDTPGSGMQIEAWGQAGDAWEPFGEVVVQPLLPDRGRAEPESEIVALAPWRRDGEERLLAVTAVFRADGGAAVAGPSISEVRLTDRGLRLASLDGEAPLPVVEFLQPIDLDGDGTDELLGSRFVHDESGLTGTDIVVLRWTADGFEAAFEHHDEGQRGAAIVETDGLPGAEVILGPGSTGEMARLTMRDDGIRVEEARIASDGVHQPHWVAGAADGAMVLVAEGGLRMVRWPDGGRPEIVAEDRDPSFPNVFVVGDGADALILTQTGNFIMGAMSAPVRVLDIGLRELGVVEPDAALAAGFEFLRDNRAGEVTAWMHWGPIMGGIEGRPAFLFGGTLVQPSGDGGYESRAFAPLTGTAPIGSAGADDGWLALGRNVMAPFGAASIYPYGGVSSGRVTMVPIEELAGRRAPEEVADVALSGAVRAPDDTGKDHLFAEGDGFEIVVSAPPGTRIELVAGAATQNAEVGDEPHVLSVPGRSTERNASFDMWLAISAPDGWARYERWQGTFVNEAPAISASAATNALAGSARVTGEASEGVVVRVDGEPLQPGAEGTFSVDVDAGLWPRDVEVVAQDPLGNEARTTVGVVGFVDYRGWPWVPIVALATVAAGIALYVRIPTLRPARTSATSPSGDDPEPEPGGVIEELDELPEGRIG